MNKRLMRLLLLLSIIFALTLAEPGVHTISIRFPGPSSDKIVLPKPAKQQRAPYPPAGFKPEQPFELPEPTYLPPSEPEPTYGPPEVVNEIPAETYGPPGTEPELIYGSPTDTYVPPDQSYGPSEFNDIQSATIVNAPLQLAPQFVPPRPNKAVSFQPLNSQLQSATIINAPVRPVSYFTLPRPERIVAFRPRRLQNQGQIYFPATYLTLPRVERLIQFAPRRVANKRPLQQQHQQSNRFSRPLPSSIFAKSNNRHSGRQLPMNIFSN